MVRKQLKVTKYLVKNEDGTKSEEERMLSSPNYSLLREQEQFF